ncbi:glycosyl transferase [Fibrobacterales bacterium]|nr:glycosyl transferase [Fibrobacterales bacterium]
MIPKKIHYCWLSSEKIPSDVLDCINSWKRIMPDYELVLWDRNKFDVNSVQFVNEACSIKKWAFAADYIRLYAIYTEGGIYLDSDVLVFKKFDDFLKYDYFSALEYNPQTKIFKDVQNNDLENIQKIPNFGFQAAIFGGIKGNAFLKDCLSWYESHNFLLANGKFRGFELQQIAPDIYAAIAQKHGFRYVGGLQELQNNMVILPSDTFAHSFENLTLNSYAVHIILGSWYNKKEFFIKKFIKQILKRNNFLRTLFGKKKIISESDFMFHKEKYTIRELTVLTQKYLNLKISE